MSPATAPSATSPAPSPAPRPARGRPERAATARAAAVERVSRLRVLAAPPTTARRLPFVAGCAGLLLASLVAVLALNIALSRGAYDVYLLQQRQTALTEQEQDLGEQLASQSSPARVSERARALGMIPSSSPAFIRLSDGAVLGSPTAADAADAPAVSSLPTAAELAAARIAAEQAAAAQAAVTEPPAETADAEQAALAAAQAAAAAQTPVAPLGDGAVPSSGQATGGTAPTTTAPTAPTEGATP